MHLLDHCQIRFEYWAIISDSWPCFGS